MDEKIMHYPVTVAKYVLRFMIIMLALSMIFGAAHLTYIWVTGLLSPDPLYFVLDIHELFEIYGMILILVVGYELLKAISIILHSEKIPFLQILRIAIIAISNKMITLDIHKTDFNTLIGLACIMVSIGVAYFCFNRKECSAEPDGH